MYEPQMTHANIKCATPVVHNKHPFKDKNNHEKLLNYIQARLRLGTQMRDGSIERYAKIDRDVAGYMRLSDDDKARARKQDQDGTPQAIEVNLPLNFVHLDDMMTYFAETFSPNRGMFYHTAKPNETQPATQIVTLMNNHAVYGGMYRQTMLSIFSILKYNLGGFYSYWGEDWGPKIQQNPTSGEISTEEQKIWEGNKVESLDLYNTFWDPFVPPTDVHKLGEWAARAFVRSHYWLASRAARGVYFNCEESLEKNQGSITNALYYRSPPDYARLTSDESGTGKTNWVSVLSAMPAYAITSGYELVETVIRINPNDFGLVAQSPATRNHYETWRFTLLDDKFIIDATYLSNIHGEIPFYFGLINDSIMGAATKSPAEIIQPLQNFASSLLNTHIKANRKRLWGVTYYDPTVVDLDKIPEGEVAAYIPIQAAGFGKDIRNAVANFNDQLETQTMSDLESVMRIIDQFFPTQSLPSQIANIDRAIDAQVAAVQQGANRRQQKAAKLLDDSLFRPLRAAMYYNIIQYQQDGVEVNDFTGNVIKINLEELRATDLPYIIGQGLKAIDRMMIAGRLQNVIYALIQSPQASQQIDILALIDYWTTMLDIDIDFTQFRLAPPQAQGQGQAGAEAGGATNQQQPVVPMTNPAAITAPLRG